MEMLILCRQRRLFYTEQKIKFSIKDFFSKCDGIRSFLQFFCAVLNKFKETHYSYFA